LSKIYDALRKAEREKGRLRKIPKRPALMKRGIKQKETFLRGIDNDFRRSLLNLRNSIDSEMKQKESRIIVFTSAVKGEGKTTIAASLARVLALSESEKVLLVDCSVVNPELHKLFGVKNDAGILEYLSGEKELPQIIQTLDAGVLDLVTVGTIREANVTQPLFNSEKMALFIGEVAEKYDYVLIDTSAILEAPETPIIGSYAEGIVMVINTGVTRREVIKRAMLMVEKLDGIFIGTVLNRKKYFIPEFIYRRV
jgi:protein-tyrosine kinase